MNFSKPFGIWLRCVYIYLWGLIKMEQKLMTKRRTPCTRFCSLFLHGFWSMFHKVVWTRLQAVWHLWKLVNWFITHFLSDSCGLEAVWKLWRQRPAGGAAEKLDALWGSFTWKGSQFKSRDNLHLYTPLRVLGAHALTEPIGASVCLSVSLINLID